ncbi:MAG: AAA family ATPase [Cytophagaceae bacterium]|nr:AAA family ATPase [Cytophagaceae bacterium]
MKPTPDVLPSDLLEKQFPFTPTPGQLQFFAQMDAFLPDDDPFGIQAFLLKGYAGTGKTTLISALIKVLSKFGYKAVLLAPTGRAAKVMATYSKKKAFTIHKKIYRQVANPHTGALEFKRQNNYHTNTLFIVDESSMITDDAEFGTRGLLTDLLEYIFMTEDGDPGNKLLLVGDTAQLPPVGKIISPALDAEYLRSQFHIGVREQELTEVMRQDSLSGILFNATNLRYQLTQEKPEILFTTKGYPDFYRMTADRLEDGLQYAYRKFGKENTIILTRSNKAAVQYNRYIRQRIFFQEEELNGGDMLMIVRNNYTWLDEDSPAGFLANGDFVEVRKIIRTEEMHGFRFATLRLSLSDYPEQEDFEAKIFLDTLYSPTASLTQEENRRLYDAVALDYAHVVSRRQRMEEIRKDPYLNALQVKFAYALTCHKSQGGQWNAVFVDQGYLTDEQINEEFIRWLYTAITRASDEVFLVNFHAEFFGEKKS